MQLCFEKFIHKKENVPPDRQNVNRSDAKLLLFPPFAFSWLQGELQHRERGGNCLQCCVFHMGCQWRSQGEGGGCMCHTMEAEQVRRRKLLALCGEDCLIKAQVFVFRTPGLCWTASVDCLYLILSLWLRDRMTGPDDGRRVSCFVSGYLGLQRRRVQGNKPLKTTLLRFLRSDVG